MVKTCQLNNVIPLALHGFNWDPALENLPWTDCNTLDDSKIIASTTYYTCIDSGVRKLQSEQCLFHLNISASRSIQFVTYQLWYLHPLCGPLIKRLEMNERLLPHGSVVHVHKALSGTASFPPDVVSDATALVRRYARLLLFEWSKDAIDRADVFIMLLLIRQSMLFRDFEACFCLLFVCWLRSSVLWFLVTKVSVLLRMVKVMQGVKQAHVLQKSKAYMTFLSVLHGITCHGL